MDRAVNRLYIEPNDDNSDPRKLARVLTERAKSQSVASSKWLLCRVRDTLAHRTVHSDFKSEQVAVVSFAEVVLTPFWPFYSPKAVHLPTSLDTLAGHDLAELKQKDTTSTETTNKEQEITIISENVEVTVVETTTASVQESGNADTGHETAATHAEGPEESAVHEDPPSGGDQPPPSPAPAPAPASDDKVDTVNTADTAELNRIYLGLRVYSSKESPATIGGQLRHEMGVSLGSD